MKGCSLVAAGSKISPRDALDSRSDMFFEIFTATDQHVLKKGGI